ncbi:glucose 1-dehydrogenase [Citreicella sp. C3M06]|uniref:SDR family NAD(P)-dependent oxidoreductase n=1 Tax=Citreicella sp. C3M06 TaxID=2841564 RepID=UPI001C08A605|nr:glucose 1-dehydrogenase [Citreicella sp. C3M06]MBU2959303.1 glucose 1-dehydrogenase [Citreicella sp. C3M06]
MQDENSIATDVRFDFTGKTVFVTGASRGIGREIALAFARDGASLILSARSIEALASVAAEIRDMGGEAVCLGLDQRDLGAIRSQIAPLGPIDVLVNNAGVEAVRDSLDVDEALWDKIVDTNLKGAFFVAQAVAAKMAEAQRGSIINLASLTSYVGVPGAVPYSASKSGVLGMTRAMAAEWAPKGIRVNAIAPGYFETDLTSVFYEDKDWVAKMIANIPAGRMGDLPDLTAAVRFLASSGANYIFGHCIVIDGGYLAKI